MKLSKTQQEVIDLMKQGWQLGHSRGRAGRVWLQQNGIGRGGPAKTISSATFSKLYKLKLIKLVEDKFPTSIYELAKEVKAIKKTNRELNYKPSQDEVATLRNLAVGIIADLLESKEPINGKLNPHEGDGPQTHVQMEFRVKITKYVDGGSANITEEFIQYVEDIFKDYAVSWNNTRSIINVWIYE